MDQCRYAQRWVGTPYMDQCRYAGGVLPIWTSVGMLGCVLPIWTSVGMLSGGCVLPIWTSVGMLGGVYSLYGPV